MGDILLRHVETFTIGPQLSGQLHRCLPSRDEVSIYGKKIPPRRLYIVGLEASCYVKRSLHKSLDWDLPMSPHCMESRASSTSRISSWTSDLMLSAYADVSACLSEETMRGIKCGFASASFGRDCMHCRAVMGLSSVTCSRYSVDDPIDLSRLVPFRIAGDQSQPTSPNIGIGIAHHLDEAVDVNIDGIIHVARLLQRLQGTIGFAIARGAQHANLFCNVQAFRHPLSFPPSDKCRQAPTPDTRTWCRRIRPS